MEIERIKPTITTAEQIISRIPNPTEADKTEAGQILANLERLNRAMLSGTKYATIALTDRLNRNLEPYRLKLRFDRVNRWILCDIDEVIVW